VEKIEWGGWVFIGDESEGKMVNNRKGASAHGTTRSERSCTIA
jgi:hypothetical protein